MTYQEALDYLFSQLPMFQRQGKAAFKKDLTNTLELCDFLGNPEKKFKSIHIAGTNGKGSTAHYVASVLQELGYKIGLYTSPHLKDYRERIKINGKMISEDDVLSFIEDNKEAFEEIKPSFFEWTVALSFQYFAKNDVDFAVIETGLGGRLDSTNVITPVLSVITNISYDHMDMLGNTLEKIAGEKAGIIKPNVPVVIGRKQKETELVFKAKSAESNSELLYATEYPEDGINFHTSYQKENINTAFSVIKFLGDKGIIQPKISLFKEGVNKVNQNTGLKGRWQVLSENPKTICDVGHNEEGLKLVLKQLSAESYNQLHFILGMVQEKDLDKILTLLPKAAKYYFCKPNVPRGLSELILANKAFELGYKGSSYTSVQLALKGAKSNANKDDLIFIGGSTFVVAEVV